MASLVPPQNNGLAQPIPEYDQLMAAMRSPVSSSSFSGLLYGNYGTGKTVCAVATIKRINDSRNIQKGIIVVETGSGADSLINHPDLLPFVRRIQFESYEQIMTLAAMIRGQIGEFANYNGIVLDEFSSMVDQENNRVHQARIDLQLMTKSEESAGENLPGSAPSWPSYKIAGNRSAVLWGNLIKVQDLHIIATAHERDVKTTKGDIIRIEPDITPASLKAIANEMHVIGRLEAHSVKTSVNDPLTYVREIQLSSTNFYVTKSRMNLGVDKFDVQYFPDAVANWLNSHSIAQSPNPVIEPVIQTATIEEPLATLPGIDLPAVDLPVLPPPSDELSTLFEQFT